MWDAVALEYRVYAKTWIDGIDGGMFWKRAVMMHSSRTFLPGSWDQRADNLCAYPDELDVGADPQAGAPCVLLLPLATLAMQACRRPGSLAP